METSSVSSFLDYFGRVRQRTLKVIQAVPADKMDWSFREGRFTIADLIRHIAATERYMWAENVAGRPSAYAGCGRKLAGGYEEVLWFFEQKHAEAINIFSSLTDADMAKPCIVPGGTMPVWKWLRAMLEHEIHHRGQLYTYLGMLDVPAPPIFGLTETELKARSVQ